MFPAESVGEDGTRRHEKQASVILTSAEQHNILFMKLQLTSVLLHLLSSSIVFSEFVRTAAVAQTGETKAPVFKKKRPE